MDYSTISFPVSPTAAASFDRIEALLRIDHHDLQALPLTYEDDGITVICFSSDAFSLGLCFEPDGTAWKAFNDTLDLGTPPIATGATLEDVATATVAFLEDHYAPVRALWTPHAT